MQTWNDPLALDRQICFALYAASRAVTNRYRPLLEPLGLTYPQYLVMLVLWERGAAPVKELGAALQLDSGTLSPLLKRLQAAGLVERRRSTADERQVLVEPTAAGRTLRERAASVPARIASATGLDLEALEALKRTLETVTAGVFAGDEEPNDRETTR
jgi:DNA-binding MarR family transcriptional regulator